MRFSRKLLRRSGSGLDCFRGFRGLACSRRSAGGAEQDKSGSRAAQDADKSGTRAGRCCPGVLNQGSVFGLFANIFWVNFWGIFGAENSPKIGPESDQKTDNFLDGFSFDFGCNFGVPNVSKWSKKAPKVESGRSR